MICDCHDQEDKATLQFDYLSLKTKQKMITFNKNGVIKLQLD